MKFIGWPRSDDRVSLWLCFGVAFIVLLGVFFRFYNLDRKVFWEDEVLGAIHTFGYTEAEIVAASPRFSHAADVQRYLRPNSSLGPIQTIRSLAAEDPQHPPVYYVVTRLWTQLSGASVAAIRTPAAIFGVLVLPCVFWLALELFGSLAPALVVVALVAVSPFFVLYSQEAREYSMWTAAIAIDAIMFLRAARTRLPAYWVAYAAITSATLYIYPLTGLVAIGFAVYLFLQERGRVTRSLLACILANLVALALFVPWLKVMNASAGVGRGMAAIFTSKLTPIEIARIFARDIRLIFFDVGSFHIGSIGSTAMDAVVTVVVIALCVYAFFALVRSTAFAVWGFVVVGLCLSMVPLLVRDLLVRGEFVYQARYFLPLLLGVQLALGALLGRAFAVNSARSAAKLVLGSFFVVVLAGEVLSCTVSARATTWWNKDEERAPAVAAIINATPQPLVISNYFTPSILELSLYLKPSIPVRLNLKCAQCTLRQSSIALKMAGYRDIFAVEAPNATEKTRYHWVDPVPFPHQSNVLNMFTFVASAR